MGPLQAKLTNNLRSVARSTKGIHPEWRLDLIPKQHVVITSGGAGIQNLATADRQRTVPADDDLRDWCLLVACANVANLLLARGATRKSRNFDTHGAGCGPAQAGAPDAVRVSVAGMHWRRSRAGCCLCWNEDDSLAWPFPESPQLPIHASPSPVVLGFAFLLSLVTGVVFGIVPAWITSRSDPAEALRGVNRSSRDAPRLAAEIVDCLSGCSCRSYCW